MRIVERMTRLALRVPAGWSARWSGGRPRVIAEKSAFHQRVIGYVRVDLRLIPSDGNSPGNKRVSRLFPATTDGVKRRPLLGSNANVADGGIRKGIRSDETRPIIPPWPILNAPFWLTLTDRSDINFYHT